MEDVRIGKFAIAMPRACADCPYKELKLDECLFFDARGNEHKEYCVYCVHHAVCEYYRMNYCGEGAENEPIHI